MRLPTNPAGPMVCTCLWRSVDPIRSDPIDGEHETVVAGEVWRYMCPEQIDGEDGLCGGCRTSGLCKAERADYEEAVRAAA